MKKQSIIAPPKQIKAVNLRTVSCKRCGKKITTLFPIISDKQGVCASCCTKEEEYEILEEQAKNKGFKR